MMLQLYQQQKYCQSNAYQLIFYSFQDNKIFIYLEVCLLIQIYLNFTLNKTRV